MFYLVDKDNPSKEYRARGTGAGALLVSLDGDSIDMSGVEIAIDPGADSDGNPLPAGFNTLAETYTYSNGQVATIAKASGSDTYTQTFSYTDGMLTGVSQWVKS